MEIKRSSYKPREQKSASVLIVVFRSTVDVVGEFKDEGRRATIKALPALPSRPRPYGSDAISPTISTVPQGPCGTVAWQEGVLAFPLW